MGRRRFGMCMRADFWLGLRVLKNGLGTKCLLLAHFRIFHQIALLDFRLMNAAPMLIGFECNDRIPDQPSLVGSMSDILELYYVFTPHTQARMHVSTIISKIMPYCIDHVGHIQSSQPGDLVRTNFEYILIEIQTVLTPIQITWVATSQGRTEPR